MVTWLRLRAVLAALALAPAAGAQTVQYRSPAGVEYRSQPDTGANARAEAALAGTEYFIQVGAFNAPDSVIAKLKAAKIPYFTEPLKDITRARAGPFPSQDAAEKVLEKLRSMGLKPGPVTTKSG